MIGKLEILMNVMKWTNKKFLNDSGDNPTHFSSYAEIVNFIFNLQNWLTQVPNVFFAKKMNLWHFKVNSSINLKDIKFLILKQLIF